MKRLRRMINGADPLRSCAPRLPRRSVPRGLAVGAATTALVLATMAGFFGSAGCDRADETDRCSCADTAVVDPALFALLSRARATHHAADLAESSGDVHRAVRLLEDLVNGPVPGGATPPPAAAEALADTRARLADLLSAEGRFDAATDHVVKGLALVPEPTHFRGHLQEVRGLVEERRHLALAKAGDTVGAEEAKRAAVQNFQEAIETQASVIQRALQQDGGAR